MRISSSSLLVSVLVGSAFTGVASQPEIGICPQPAGFGEKCNVCTPGSDPKNKWTTDCRLRVSMKCTYVDNGRTKSCFPPGNSVNNDDPEPTWEYTQEECDRGGAALEFPATIVYEMCNANDQAFTPIAEKNFIKFAHNRRLESESIIENAVWDSTINAQACRTQTYTTTLKPCTNKWRGMALEMDGNLAKNYPDYCRCFLREYLLAEISATPNPGPGTKAPVPAPKPVTRAPIPAPKPDTKAPTPAPQPVTEAPVEAPRCDFTDVVITELASPEESFAKYIELYFADKNCAGVTITEDIKVISYGPGDCEPSSITIDLKGETIRDDGFFTICNSASAEVYYGRGECTVIGGLTSPANLRGTEAIAIIDSDEKVIDIFGIPCTDPNPNKKQYFVNGRAVRKIDAWDPSPYFVYDNWHVFPGCGQEVGPEAMDINKWQDTRGPICYPKAKILITEIVDLDVDSVTQVPRYVELHAPRLKHRGMGFDHDLKLVIFHSDSTEPHWASAVPIDYMPESGFLLVCNKAAYEKYGDECSEVSTDIAGPANSNGNDQIALISGDEEGWFVTDIYGVIGEDGYDTDHDFFNSRVIRKLYVTGTRATWNKYDWQLCKSDVPDPMEWNSDECGGADDSPSVAPTDSPTPESQKDCEFFFTELSDYGETPYIEIKSTCPGITISRDLSVTSWKEYGVTCDVNLKGVRVPDDGFIIICANKIKHELDFGGQFEIVDGVLRDLAICDIENFNLLAYNGLNSYAILDKNIDCVPTDCLSRDCYTGCSDKYVDIYGYRDSSLASSPYKYDDCRVVRITEYPYGLSWFEPEAWEVVCIPAYDASSHPKDVSDPRKWEDIPLVLFFSEFCNPSDAEAKRYIELYSPNKRNYKIKKNLIVMKWEGESLTPSYKFQSITGQTINKNGFLVLCINWYAWDEDVCTLQTGYNGFASSDGDNNFALAECENPAANCNYIDVYGVPGVSGTDTYQDFSNGRAYRYEFFHPVARKVFDAEQWVVRQDVDSSTCDPGVIDPDTTKPPFPAPKPPSSPTPPTGGGGGGGGKSKSSKKKKRFLR